MPLGPGQPPDPRIPRPPRPAGVPPRPTPPGRPAPAKPPPAPRPAAPPHAPTPAKPAAPTPPKPAPAKPAAPAPAKPPAPALPPKSPESAKPKAPEPPTSSGQDKPAEPPETDPPTLEYETTSTLTPRPWLWDIVIMILVLALYVPAIRGQFTWDDWRMVRDSEALRTLGGLGRIWFKPGEFVEYYPLTYTTFWIEYQIFGAPLIPSSTQVAPKEPPYSYHLVNILLHGGVAIALRRLLVRLAVPGAAVAALLFAAHPVFVESVAWIAERKNVLSTLFYLTSAIAFIRFIESQSRASAKWWYLGSMGLFAAALLSKSPAIILPVMLLLICWWLQQTRPAAPAPGASKQTRREDLESAHPESVGDPASHPVGLAGMPPTLGRCFFQLLPFFALAALSAGMTIWMENFRPKLLAPVTWSLGQRVALAGQVPWFYLSKLLFPRNLLMIYPGWNVDAIRILGYLGLLALFVVLGVFWLLRHRLGRGPIVGWAHYILALAPVMGLINIDYFRFSLVADHFQYLAGMGMIALLVGLAAAALRAIVPDARRWRVVGAPVAAALVLVLGVLTFARASLFGEVEMLWTRTLERNPTSWMARMVLAQHQLESKRIKPAIRVLEEGLKHDPQNAEVHEQLAHLYFGQNEMEQALEHLARGTHGRAVVGRLYSNHAMALLQAGNYREAEIMFRKGLAAKNEPVVRAVIQANLVSLLATCPDPRVQNPREAVQLAHQLCAEPGGRNGGNLMLLAIAQAFAGNFEAARTSIEEATVKARDAGDERLLESIHNTRLQIEQMAAAAHGTQSPFGSVPAPATGPATPAAPSTVPASPPATVPVTGQ